MNIKTIITLLALSLLLVSLSACTPVTTTQEPKTNFPSGEEENTAENIVDNIIPVEINYQEVKEATRYQGTRFLATPADEFGDESTFNRITNSNSFEVAVEVTLDYATPERFEGKKVPLYFVDEGTQETIFEGNLLDGTHTYKMILVADHAGYAPRFKVCYGDLTICEQLRTDAVNNQLSLNTNSLVFVPDRDLVKRQVFIANNGNTYLTAFIHVPETPNYDMKINASKLTLAPGEEQIVTFSISAVKQKDTIYAQVYALADSCSPSEACADTAKVVEEIKIQY